MFDLGSIFDTGLSLVGDFFSGLGDTALDWGGQALTGLGNFGSNALTSAMNNPWQTLGVGLQGAGTLGGLLMRPDMPQMPELPGIQSQMGQGTVTPQQVARRRVADVQSQGLSGASPDFLATMAGVTPEELNQMLGYGGR